MSLKNIQNSFYIITGLIFFIFFIGYFFNQVILAYQDYNERNCVPKAIIESNLKAKLTDEELLHPEIQLMIDSEIISIENQGVKICK